MPQAPLDNLHLFLNHIYPHLRPAVEMIRKTMAEFAPAVTERPNPEYLQYYRRYRIATVKMGLNVIYLDFPFGDLFVDPYGRLKEFESNISGMRLKIRSIDEINENMIRHYINQAIDVDGRPETRSPDWYARVKK